MKRFFLMLICLALLSGCASAPAPVEDASQPPEPTPAEATDVTLTIGRKLPLPVTEARIREYYLSPDGFYRYALDIREENGDFLVWSVPMPYTDTGEVPDEDTRFDWVYGESGYCYALLEGRYTMDEVLSAGQGSITLNTDGEEGCPVAVSAGLVRSLVNTGTGEPVQQDGLHCASVANRYPREISLASGTLQTLPGNGAASSLEALYPGADSLELVFDTSEQAAFPQVEVSYDESIGELTLTCLDTDLLCTVSGNNLYMEGIRAEQRGADTAVICSLGTAAPDEPWMHSAHANAIQVETEFLSGYDWGKGVLRLTFWPFMG